MQPYSYRDSGIEWLGKIPTHWKVDRIKDQIVNVVGGDWGSDPEGDQSDTVVLRVADIDGLYFSYANLTTRTIKHTSYNVRSIDKHCLLIEKSGGGEKQLVGRVAYPRELTVNAVCSNFMARILVNCHTDPEFLNYLFHALYNVRLNFAHVNQTTGIQNLNVTSYLSEKSAFPPIEEQRAIAGFLDEACGKIDAAIQVKREQSDKITKHYHSRVYEVIKSGLHAGVQTKDSGSAWLGKVPQHWKVKKLKYLADILRGKFNHRPRNDPEFYNGDYPFIQTGDVSRADKYIQSYSQTLNERGYAVSKEFPAGTLTMTIAANIGDVAILNFAACFPDSVVGFKPHHEVELEFLYYLLLALRQDVMSTAILTTQLNLNIVRVGSTLAVIPPKSEQQEIVTYLNNLKQKTDDLSEGLNEQIRILEAYKKSLVHECVTGKKQVWLKVSSA